MLTIKKREYDLLPDGVYFVKIENVDSSKPNIYKQTEDDPDTSVEYTFIIQRDEDGGEEK